jgi:hypothetical protein
MGEMDSHGNEIVMRNITPLSAVETFIRIRHPMEARCCHRVHHANGRVLNQVLLRMRNVHRRAREQFQDRITLEAGVE